jgi:hypothetical protein
MQRRTASTTLQRAAPAPREIADPDEFSVGDVLAEGFRTWLSQLPVFAGIALLLHAPLLLFAFLPPLPRLLFVVALLAAELAIALLVKAALVKAVIDYQRQLPTDFLEYLQAVGSNAWAVLVLGVRILSRAAIRSFLLLVPGVNYLCETFAAVPAVIVEGVSTGEALRRSQQLTKGVHLQVFGICLVIWSVGAVWTLAFDVHHGAGLSSTTWMIFYLCIRALERSLAAVLSAITYQHLCARPDQP